ncbi:hypothetical protein ID866_8936 [Astraeus odoratus]|nr:hypothetical protein ID866_8936 [Astraeus odoratus]
MGDNPVLLYIYFATTISLVVLPLFWFLKSPNLNHIQTAGSPGFLGSYWTAIRFVVHGQKYLQEGYNQYKPYPFKVRTLYGWLVILNRKHLDDIAKASEADLSFFESANDLSRNLASLCPDIKDEISHAFNEILDIAGNEWKAVPAFESLRKIVTRTSNRAFVGLPLCRDPGWNALNIQQITTIVKEALMLRFIPTFIQP